MFFFYVNILKKEHLKAFEPLKPLRDIPKV